MDLLGGAEWYALIVSAWDMLSKSISSESAEARSAALSIQAGPRGAHIF